MSITLAPSYDLYNAEELQIESHSHFLVSTDIALIILVGLYGWIKIRSGLGGQKLIDINAGVRDAD